MRFTIMLLSHPVRALLLLFSAFLLVWAGPVRPAHSTQTGSASPTASRFAGTWQATFEGKTIIVLKLQGTPAPTSGTIQLAGFQLDIEGNGALMAVTDSQLDSPFPLRNLKSDGKILSFDFVDRDGDDDNFQMELPVDQPAKLQWAGPPANLKAQPIPLTRTVSYAPKSHAPH